VKQEGLKERVELLEAGEKLGYPRLGYGRSTKIPHDKRIPQGQPGWETFCAHAHIRRILPALRIARVLRDNNVIPYHPLSGKELAPAVTLAVDAEPGPPVEVIGLAVGTRGVDLLDDIIGAPAIVPVQPAPRKKRGGHKKPPHPLSKRARRV
jgi:hypothetical protein